MKLSEEITVAVIDDDEQTIDRLRGPLEQRANLRLVDVPSDPDRVLDEDSSPELLLVDPLGHSQDAQALLETLTSSAWPLIIVVTSDPGLAVASFEWGVVDFVVKPLAEPRLSLALDRGIGAARVRREGHLVQGLRNGSDPRGESGGPGGSARFPGRLLIREQGGAYFLETDRIRYIQSDGNYLRIYDEEGYHLARGTMSQILECLDFRFVRIHRSTIVNIDRVKEFVPDMKGRYLVRIDGDTELVLSRGYRDDVLRWVL